jgi:hypothetical protein
MLAKTVPYLEIINISYKSTSVGSPACRVMVEFGVESEYDTHIPENLGLDAPPNFTSDVICALPTRCRPRETYSWADNTDVYFVNA